MKRQILFSIILLLTICGVSQAQDAEIKRNPNPTIARPDLAFGNFKRLDEGKMEITVVNKGKAKSNETEGGYGCASLEKTNGFGVGWGGEFFIKQLAAGETQKIVLSCGEKAKTLSVSLDGKNKVKESNENNNSIKF